MCLEHGPSEMFLVCDSVFRITRKVASEEYRSAKDEQVWVMLCHMRPFYNANCESVRQIGASSCTELLKAGISRFPEGTLFDSLEIVLQFADDADLIAVLEGVANTWYVGYDINPKLLQLGFWTNTAKFEKLRRVESPCTEDDLPRD